MKKILVCNHKMFLSRDEALILNEEISNLDTKNIDLILCPSYLNFEIFKNYKLCSQDAFYEDKGAFTGEISSYHLSLLGVKYSLVAHKDRRLYDTSNVINLKVKSILRNSMTPIICIGEEKIEKELRKTCEVLRKQIKDALKNVELEDNQIVYIAYEPSFLIGKNVSLNKNEIEDTIDYIKKVLESIGITNYKILYGGGVNANNIKDIDSQKIDGYLLGYSSIDKNELKTIIECIK